MCWEGDSAFLGGTEGGGWEVKKIRSHRWERRGKMGGVEESDYWRGIGLMESVLIYVCRS